MSPVPEAIEESQTNPQEGDVYDEDSGDFIGTIALGSPVLPPAQLGVLINGYWYVYQPVTRYKNEDAEVVHDVTHSSLSAIELLKLAGEVKRDDNDIPADRSILP